MFTRTMINCVHLLWQDEAGYILSAEAVLVGTVGVLGATVGLTAVTQTVNDELTEVALAYRSLDQSFHIKESRGCGAWTAGSSYVQRPVEESRAELAADIARWEKEAEVHEHRLKEKMDREHQEMHKQGAEHHHLHQDMHKRDIEKPDIKKPDSPKPEMKKPESGKSEMKKSDNQKSGASKEEMKKEDNKKKHRHDDDKEDDNNDE